MLSPYVASLLDSLGTTPEGVGVLSPLKGDPAREDPITPGSGRRQPRTRGRSSRPPACSPPHYAPRGRRPPLTRPTLHGTRRGATPRRAPTPLRSSARPATPGRTRRTGSERTPGAGTYGAVARPMSRDGSSAALASDGTYSNQTDVRVTAHHACIEEAALGVARPSPPSPPTPPPLPPSPHRRRRPRIQPCAKT